MRWGEFGFSEFIISNIGQYTIEKLKLRQKICFYGVVQLGICKEFFWIPKSKDEKRGMPMSYETVLLWTWGETWQESSSNPLFYSCHLKNAVPLMPVNAYLCPYISRCKVVRILGCTVPSDFYEKYFDIMYP